MAGIEKLISFEPSNFKICLCETLDQHNVSQRAPGPPPGFGGYEGEFLQILVQNLGVNFDYIVNDDYGVLLENGTQTGCQGILQRKEADILVCSSLHIIDDAEIAEPSSSFYDLDLKFVTKIPDVVPKFDIFIHIFDMESLTLIGISLLFVSFVFFLLSKGKNSYLDYLISNYADLVLQKPIVKIKETLPLEILTTFWVIGSQFIPLFAMAVILTAVMVPERMPPIDNYEKLLKAIKAGEYKAGTFKISPNVLIIGIEGSQDAKLRETGKFIRENDWQFDLDETNYVNVLQNNTAIATLSLFSGMYIPPNYPVTIFKDSILGQISMCIYTVRSFPFRKRVNKIIQRIIEAGLYRKNYDFYMFKTLIKNFKDFKAESDDEERPLTLNDLLGPFIFLGVGLFCSVICLICEIIVHKIKTRNLSKKIRKRKKGIHTNRKKLRCKL